MSRTKIIVIAAIVIILISGIVAAVCLMSLSNGRPGYVDPPVDGSSDILQL